MQNKKNLAILLTSLMVGNGAQAVNAPITADITIKGVSGFSGTVYVNSARNLLISTKSGEPGEVQGYQDIKPGDTIYGFYTHLESSIQPCASDTQFQDGKHYEIVFSPKNVVSDKKAFCSIKVTEVPQK